MHNSEDDALDTNIAKDSGDGMFILQYCFFQHIEGQWERCVLIATLFLCFLNTFLCVYNVVYFLVTYIMVKKLDCVTLRMMSWIPTHRRTVEKVCSYSNTVSMFCLIYCRFPCYLYYASYVKKWDCVTLRMTRWTPMLRRIVEKVSCYCNAGPLLLK